MLWPNPGSTKKNAITFAAIRMTVIIGKRLVGFASEIGITHGV